MFVFTPSSIHFIFIERILLQRGKGGIKMRRGKRRRRHPRHISTNRELRLIIRLLRQLINRSIIPNIVINANPTAQSAQDHANNAGSNLVDHADDSNVKIETKILE
jgi:hypothetical protein